MNTIFQDFKKSFDKETIDKLKNNVFKEDKFTFFSLLQSFLEEDNLRWGVYVKKVCLLQYIEIISINDEQEESLAKPDIVEVLQDKINILHQSIKNVEKERNDLKIKELSSAYHNLFELPVKYSFTKYKKVVSEISRDLGKKVKFILKGDQGLPQQIIPLSF